MNVYTTVGRVRGCCGHRHRTIRTAAACVKRDRRENGTTDRDLGHPDGKKLGEAAFRLFDAEMDGVVVR